MKPQEALRLAKACLAHQGGEDDSLTQQSVSVQRVCSLWAGMGSIYHLKIPNRLNVAVKYIPLSKKQSDVGERRKAVAYHVEANFYQHAVPRLAPFLRLPQLYYMERPHDQSITLCIEWMNGDISSSSWVEDTLTWLATLHSLTWGSATADEWVQSCELHEQGTYWHLDTRRDEHARMPATGWEGRLKRAARAIHDALQRDGMQCLVHGDVKEPNILFDDKHDVTLCDFQYTGKGSPTKDVAYFLCSSVHMEEHNDEELLRHYYSVLTQKLTESSSDVPSWEHFQKSMNLAYCDFCRFMSGWGYWGSVDVLQSRVRVLLDSLDHGKDLGSEEAYDAAVRELYW